MAGPTLVYILTTVVLILALYTDNKHDLKCCMERDFEIRHICNEPNIRLMNENDVCV